MTLFYGLLAQRANWERLGERFSGRHTRFDSGDIWGIVLAIALAAALLAALHLLARRQETGEKQKSTGRLFGELCRSHRLSWSQRRLLKRLAAAVGAESPADVFLRPDWFGSSRLPAELSDSAEQVREVGMRLFGDLKRRAATKPSRLAQGAAVEAGAER